MVSNENFFFKLRAERGSVCDRRGGSSEERRAGGPFLGQSPKQPGLCRGLARLEPHQPSARTAGQRHRQKGKITTQLQRA